MDGELEPLPRGFMYFSEKQMKSVGTGTGTGTAYLPVFYRHELNDMLRTCFPHHLPQEALIWSLYEKWGGIVRYVLGKLDAESQLELEDAFTSANLEELFFHLGARALESDGSTSHRLLHLKPVGEGAVEFSNPSDINCYALARSQLA